MSDTTPASYRALISPDLRSTLLTDQTTITEAGATLGSPTRVSGEASLSLKASGTPSSAQESKLLQVRAQSSGAADRATFGFTQSGDALARGWNPPHIPTTWNALDWTDGSSTIKSTLAPNATTLENGKVVVVYEREKASWREIVSRVYTPSTDTWSGTSLIYLNTDTAAVIRPTVVVLPSGRLLCFHWVSSATEAQIRMHYSTDEGSTWTLGSWGCLEEPVDVSTSPGAGAVGFDIGRLRAVWSGSGVALVAAVHADNTSLTYRRVFRQWASVDLGASFSEVGSAWDGTNDEGKAHDLLDIDGTLALVYVSAIGGYTAQIRRTGSIFDPLASVPDVQISNSVAGAAGEGDLAAWVDEAKNLFVVTRRVTGNRQLVGSWSEDGGTKWSPLGSSDLIGGDHRYGLISDLGVTSNYLRKITAAPSGGRVFLFHSWLTSPANEDNSLAVLSLGGWSTVTSGSVDLSRDFDRAASYKYHYYPVETPDNIGWTASGAGTATLDAPGELVLLSSGTNSRFYFQNNTDAITSGMWFSARLAVTSGGAIASPRAGVALRLANGSTEYEIQIRLNPSTIRLYDAVAAGAVGSDVSVAVSSGVDLIAWMDGAGAVKVWYKLANTSEDQQFVLGWEATISAKTSGAAANNRVRFGRIVNSSAAVTRMTVGRLQYTTGTYNDAPTSTLANQRGRRAPTYLAGGISSDAFGVAYTGDLHSIPVSHDYEIERALPLASPSSPRVGWRSTDESLQKVAILLSRDKSETTDALSGSLGVALFGINWKAGKIQGFNSSVWVDLATIDTTTGLSSLAWTRKGDTVRPNATPGTPQEFHSHELAGAYFKFDGGDCRKIRTNPSGAWTTSTSYRRGAIALEGTDGGEGSTGTSGAIWPKNVAFLISLKGADYSAYRIQIDASQGTAEGYYTIGQIVLGGGVLLADAYSFGRTIETSTSTEIVEGRDRIERTSTPAPNRRIAAIAWTDGVDEKGSRDVATGSAAAGSLPLATHGETLHQMEGLLRTTEGGAEALVYLPRVERTSDDFVLFNRRKELMLARVTTDIRLDTVLGEENVDELARSNSLTLKEIV